MLTEKSRTAPSESMRRPSRPMRGRSNDALERAETLVKETRLGLGSRVCHLLGIRHIVHAEHSKRL
jgi:hypothetical protein